MTVSRVFSFGNGHILAFEGEANATYPRLFRSRNYGDSWDTIKNNGLPASAVFAWATWYNNEFWTGISSEGIYTSQDSGNTWKHHPTYGKNSPHCFVAKDSIFITGSQGDLQKSTDFGKTWEYGIQISCLPDPTIVTSIISSMEFRNILYVGTMYGIFASKDWGKTWEKRGLNYLNAPGAKIGSLLRIDTTLFVGTYSCILKSNNYGINDDWIYLFDSGWETAIKLIDSTKMFISFVNSSKQYFLFSPDSGKTFVPFSISNPDIYCYRIESDDKYVYILNLKGIYRNLKKDPPTNVQTTKLEINKDELVYISQYQNNLTFSVKTPLQINISLFKLNGQKVFCLKNKQLSDGQFNINLNNYKISSGLYLLKIQSSHTNQTRAVHLE